MRSRVVGFPLKQQQLRTATTGEILFLLFFFLCVCVRKNVTMQRRTILTFWKQRTSTFPASSAVHGKSAPTRNSTASFLIGPTPMTMTRTKAEPINKNKVTFGRDIPFLSVMRCIASATLFSLIALLNLHKACSSIDPLRGLPFHRPSTTTPGPRVLQRRRTAQAAIAYQKKKKKKGGAPGIPVDRVGRSSRFPIRKIPNTKNGTLWTGTGEVQDRTRSNRRCQNGTKLVSHVHHARWTSDPHSHECTMFHFGIYRHSDRTAWTSPSHGEKKRKVLLPEQSWRPQTITAELDSSLPRHWTRLERSWTTVGQPEPGETSTRAVVRRPLVAESGKKGRARGSEADLAQCGALALPPPFLFLWLWC